MNILKMERSVRWAFNFSNWHPTEAEMRLATSCIQPEEKERLARFVFKKDFKPSIIGRLMMRKFVHETTKIPYNEIKFQRDDKGKPYLENQNFAFNVSHHGSFAVLAGETSSPSPVGVDVMTMEYAGTKSLGEYFRIMNRPFSEAEWVEIKRGSEKEQIGMFTRHWCLKESYVKAIGVGITVSLRDISFKINTRELKSEVLIADTELFVRGGKMDWIFEESLLDDQHCVAVALCGKSGRGGVFQELSFSEIVENAVPLLDSDEEYCRKFFEKLDAP